MKNILLAVIMFTGISLSVRAQCEKKINWIGAKAEFVDDSGKVERTIDEKIVFQTSGHEIKVVHSDQENDALTGVVSQSSCNWTEKYKNGKSVFTAKLTEAGGDTMDGTVTVEAKDGHIIIILQLQGPNGTKIIRVPIDTYKEL